MERKCGLAYVNPKSFSGGCGRVLCMPGAAAAPLGTREGEIGRAYLREAVKVHLETSLELGPVCAYQPRWW